MIFGGSTVETSLSQMEPPIKRGDNDFIAYSLLSSDCITSANMQLELGSRRGVFVGYWLPVSIAARQNWRRP
jgi:hypothetical protein